MQIEQQYCTFYLDRYYFGIEVERVQEIIRYQEITPVALAPHVVRGLINLRGQIVTAVDLRRLLELPDRTGDDDQPPSYMNIAGQPRRHGPRANRTGVQARRSAAVNHERR